MIDQDQNDESIRRIINPKNGFSLFLRKFNDDDTVAQISTDESFNTPSIADITNQKIDQTFSKELKTLSDNHIQLIQQLQKTNTELLKQQKLIRIIAAGVVILTFLSISL